MGRRNSTKTHDDVDFLIIVLPDVVMDAMKVVFDIVRDGFTLVTCLIL